MPLAGYELRELDWDTKFFGVKMGRVLLPTPLETTNFSELAWQRTLELAHYQNYQFLFCPFDVYHQEIATIIAGHGGTIGDILVTFSLDITGLLKRKIKYRITEAEAKDLPGIIEIASKSFRDSRFLKDSHFDRAKAHQFYPSWLKESFFGTEKILVVKEEQQVLGFISLKPEYVYSEESADSVESVYPKKSRNETLIIQLIAVNDSWQGKGLGQILIDQAINLAIDQNYCHLRVGTQLTNCTAINLYEKNGFRMINAKYRYHIWLKQIANV